MPTTTTGSTSREPSSACSWPSRPLSSPDSSSSCNPLETENKPYWIIDILPKQVPADFPGRYFTVEKYFLAHLGDLCTQFARVLLKLNCYRALLLSTDDETWTGTFSPDDLPSFFHTSADTHSPLFIRIQPTDALRVPTDALLTFSGDDHYLTLYNPDE